MMESILSKQIGKRSIIGFISGGGRVEMTICIPLAVDDKFIQVKSVNENAQQGIIQKGIVSFIPLTSIDSVVDATDDEIYNSIMNNINARVAQAQRAAANAQQQQGQPPVEEEQSVAPGAPQILEENEEG